MTSSHCRESERCELLFSDGICGKMCVRESQGGFAKSFGLGSIVQNGPGADLATNSDSLRSSRIQVYQV